LDFGFEWDNMMKSRLNKTGLLLLETGVILILIGGVMTAKFSRRAFIALNEGQTVSSLENADGRQIGALPFSVRLNRFSIERDPKKAV
jgi:cytochrome c biogenesis factor